MVKLWAGLKTADGRQIWPGLVPGGEAGPGGWANWITGAMPGKSGHLNLGIPFFRFMLFDDPNWDYHSFRLEQLPTVSTVTSTIWIPSSAHLFNAINPDLSTRSKARGGKLIQRITDGATRTYHAAQQHQLYYESVPEGDGPGSTGRNSTNSIWCRECSIVTAVQG